MNKNEKIKTVTIDFSKCILHKEKGKEFVILSSSPRRYKGKFTNEICFLPKKVCEVISHEKNELDITVKLIIKIPRWIFAKQIEGKKEIVSRIKIVNFEKEN